MKKQISNFSDFFNELEDEFLMMLEPDQLQRLCIFLALDLQMLEEEKSKRQIALLKEIKSKLGKKKKSSYTLEDKD